MRLHENIDFTTLTWVKPELDETLRQARNALQNFVEEGADPGQLRECSTLLHQVQGTLRMVELYGAAMVAEEMEQLSKALLDDKVASRDDAFAVLMQGIVQLPDYLERLQSGHRDLPIVLLPLLNQLRAARGEKGLVESVLFAPDLTRPLPPSAKGPTEPLAKEQLSRRAEGLHNLFQGALLRWLKDDNSPSNIRDLTDVCDQLVPITHAEAPRRLFWIAAGTLDALGKNVIQASKPLKQALAKVEREIKRLADGGDAAFRTDPPLDLTKQLLYFVAQEGTDQGRIGEIRETFGLGENVPSEAELAHARGSLTGHNRALLETVAVAIKEDLMRVKDALDLHLRTPGATPADLNAQVEALDRVADTLGMLGLGVPRRVVQEQRTAITDVVSGHRKNDEATLLDIAGALLYVEASLDDQVERLGQGDTPAAAAAAEAKAEPAAALNLPTTEARKVLEVLIKEAIANFAQARQSFVAFVETHWDHAQLTDVPRLLEEVSGALRILDMPVPGEYLVAVKRFTENELLRRRRVPNGQQMDHLADALAGLEYFLESVRDRRPNREHILDVARQSLEALGYWPLPPEEVAEPVAEAAPVAPVAAAPVAAPVVEAPVAVETPAVETPAPAIEPAPVVAAPPTAAPAIAAAPVAPAPVATPAPAPAPAPAAVAPAPAAAAPVAAPAVAAVPAGHVVVPGFDGASSEEIDDEIREVFLEEFEEEIANLEQMLPGWKADPASAELLRPIRRVFHTLKGSGRLVGAKTLGELSWKVESMLNRVLDGSRPASPAVVALVEHTFGVLPLIRAALQGQTVYADLDGIGAVADRIAAGEDVLYHPAVAEVPVVAEVEAPVVEAVPEPEVVAAAPVAAPAVEAEAVPEEEERGAFAIDPVLFEILKPEVGGHLEAVDAWLAICAARGPQPVTDPLLRSVHTMNGAFAMTDVVPITDVTAPLEGYIKRCLAHQTIPSAAGIAVIADSAEAIRQTIAAMEKPRPTLPNFEALAKRAQELRDLLPDPLMPSVPVHAEQEDVMPQAVALEAPDVSRIPQFSAPEPIEGMIISPASVFAADLEEPSEAETPVTEPGLDERPREEVEIASSIDVVHPVELESAPMEPVVEPVEAAAPPSAVEELPETEMVSLDQFLTAETAEPAEAPSLMLTEEAELTEPEAPVAAAPEMAAEEFSAFEAFEAESAAEAEAAAEIPSAPEPVAEAVPVPESIDADSALSAMIEAYSSEEATFAEAPAVVEPVAMETEEASAVTGEAPAELIEETAAEAEVVEPIEALTEEPAEAAAIAEEPALETEALPPVEMVDDQFYGMSLEELEAMTAPAAAEPTAPAEAEPELPAMAAEEQLVAEEEVAEAETVTEPEAEPVEVAAAPVEPEPVEAVAAPAEPEPEVAEEEPVFADAEDERAPIPAMPVAASPRVAAPRPSVPMANDPTDPDAALDLTDLDPELLDIFLEESGDILDHSDGLLSKLRDHTDDKELVVGLQRDLHTLKGGARMAGIFAVGELGHTMESLLEAAAEGRHQLDAIGVILLERGFDRLHTMVGRVGERKAIALPAGLIAQLDTVAEGKTLEAAEAASAEQPAATPAAAPSEEKVIARKAEAPAPAVPAAPLKPLSAPMDATADEEELSSVRAPQEQVRIRADLLDRLVNYAGEVAIYRARLEQQLGAFRANLGELNQTTTRLREQLRRLEIETEAQIVARYQREGEVSDETFDPLELDRFSTQQQLSRGLSESANDIVNIQTTLDDLTRQYETLLLQQSRVSSDLQEGLMRTRMVPFDALVPRLRRVLRQAASDTGKQVQLKVDGASGEMDRNVLDRMTAPLEHMLRNSMAHGLELPEERRKAGKPEEGLVRVAVQREGSEVVLKISDDGRGLNKEAIRKKAIERGLLNADAEISDETLYGLILESGFSTAETVSRLAGRGVGMDVVYSEIRQLGGTLQIRSEQGKGSEFIIRLPFTLAVTQAVFVKIGDTSFAVPIASVQGVGRISRSELEKQLAGEHPVFSYAGEDYAIHDLGTLIGHAPAKAQDSLQMPLLLARSGDLRAAICIDQVLGSREIVVKPVGPQVNSVPGIFGATIMGDGRVVVILDVAPLVRRHVQVARETTTPVVAAPVVAARHVPVVMVVDDSITMRKVTGRVLERNNMEVMTAKDGVDAVEKMAERVPDLVLLDIEMPRMDGYEVAQNMRSDPRLKDVPIIMITSRTGEKHRQRAMDIGVNRYLGKPYQEPELMRNVFEMLGLEPVNG